MAVKTKHALSLQPPPGTLNIKLGTLNSMQPGISSYTFTWAIGVPGKEPKNPMTIFQLIEKAAELDVPVLQVADNLPLDRFSEIELLKIRNYAEDLHIQIEVGARGMTAENLEKHIELAVFFQSPIVRFVIDGAGFEPGLEEIHQIIKNAVPVLKENKIVLTIENHDRFKAAEFAEMVEKAGSEFVGICLDSVNSMGAGEGLLTVIEKLAPLTVNLHVKEFSVKRVFHKMGFVIEGCPLGEGMLPIAELIQKVSPRCQSAILEQWTPPEESIEKTIEKEARWAEVSITYLKSLCQNPERI
jgi:sugar phosphate isomerase/epimerase